MYSVQCKMQYSYTIIFYWSNLCSIFHPSHLPTLNRPSKPRWKTHHELSVFSSKSCRTKSRSAAVSFLSRFIYHINYNPSPHQPKNVLCILVISGLCSAGLYSDLATPCPLCFSLPMAPPRQTSVCPNLQATHYGWTQCKKRDEG